MYGTRESFNYNRCRCCGSLQIAEIPQDLERHYPADYYSQLDRDEPPEFRGLKGFVSRWYCRVSAMRPHSLPAILVKNYLPEPDDFRAVGQYLTEARLSSGQDRILDVGCGASPYRLAAMRRCGFASVEGVDPFIEGDLIYSGIPVSKCTIDEVDGVFGMVMFHHSLEHVPDPLSSLKHAARLLRSGGLCLVRVPVMGTYFWRKFRENWVELDAPRHLHLLSVEGMWRIASSAGFRVRKVVFDSESWEIAGSIRYSRNIALRESGTSDLGPETEALQHSSHAHTVDQLNRLGDAGRAAFFLEKV